MKYPYFVLVVWWLSMAFCARAQGHKYAIVVGAGRYPDSLGWPPTLAAHDAERLAKALEMNNWEVLLLSTNLDVDRQPNQANLLKLLGLVKDAGDGFSYRPDSSHFSGDSLHLYPDDLVAFIWGGHGLIQPGNGEDFLVPVDAALDGQKVVNPENLIPWNWVRYALKKTGAGKIILFSDACRINVGSIKRNTTALYAAVPIPLPEVAGTEEEPQGIFTMYSAENDEFSHDDPALGGGVFSFFLHKLLSDETAQHEADVSPKDRVVSLLEAAKYLKKQTSEYVEQLPSKKSTQQPYYEFGQADEALFNAPLVYIGNNRDKDTSFEPWLNFLLNSADHNFEDIKKPSPDSEDFCSLAVPVKRIWGIEFTGTFERDFADRNAVVFRTGQDSNELLQPCLDKILSHLGTQFGFAEKRHKRIYTFHDNRHGCSISVVHEIFPAHQSAITLEIRKNKL